MITYLGMRWFRFSAFTDVLFCGEPLKISERELVRAVNRRAVKLNAR